jgi:hypothetical protein
MDDHGISLCIHISFSGQFLMKIYVATKKGIHFSSCNLMCTSVVGRFHVGTEHSGLRQMRHIASSSQAFLSISLLIEFEPVNRHVDVIFIHTASSSGLPQIRHLSSLPSFQCLSSSSIPPYHSDVGYICNREARGIGVAIAV